MTFNLADLSTTTEATFDLELVHPVKGATGLFVTHKSATAPEIEALSRKQGNGILLKNYKAQRKGKPEDAAPTIEEGTERDVEVFVAATTAWFTMDRDKAGNLDPKTRKDGWPPMEPGATERTLLTPASATKFYADPGYRWARTLLDESMGDLERFLAK